MLKGLSNGLQNGLKNGHFKGLSKGLLKGLGHEAGKNKFLPITDKLAFRYDASIPSSIHLATGVSQWDDISGLNRHATQSTTTKQPVFTGYGTSGMLTFDGTDDYLQAAIAFSQPYTVYIVFKQISWTSLDYIITGAAANARFSILQYSVTPGITLYDGGGSLSLNPDMTIGSVKVLAAVFNNTASSTSVNDKTKVNFAAGGGVGGTTFVRIGADGAGTGASNIGLQELIGYNSAHVDSQQTQIVNFLKNKWKFYQP